MANKIVINLDPFMKTQKVMMYHEGDNQAQVYATVDDVDRVGETLAALVANQDVDEVCIFGPDAFLEQPIHDFTVYSETLFKENNKNVRLVINGKVSN